MTKLNELKAGDKVRVTGFTCVATGEHEVCDNGNGLFIRCDRGNHYLCGQEDEPGADLVGVTKIE